MADAPRSAAAPSVGGGPITQAGPARPLDWDELTDVIDLALWTGLFLLEHGSSAMRVEDTVLRVGSALGCDRLDVLVSPNAIIVTTTEGHEFRTKLRRVTRFHVQLAAVVKLSTLVKQVEAGRLGRKELRAALDALCVEKPPYPRPLVVLMVGAACFAFAKIFGADWASAGVAFGAAATGMALRQELMARKTNPLLNVLVVAFVTASVASLLLRLVPSGTPQHALAASVLFLVPGVPLINAVEEVVKGHGLIALSRGAQGLLVLLAIALGLLVAMRVLAWPLL